VDWKLNSDGDLDFSGVNMTRTTGLDAVAQKIRLAMTLRLGEWFLDREKGMAYGDILGKKYSELTVLDSARSVLLGVTEVNSILKISSTFNRTTRTVHLKWTVDTTLGTLDGAI